MDSDLGLDGDGLDIGVEMPANESDREEEEIEELKQTIFKTFFIIKLLNSFAFNATHTVALISIYQSSSFPYSSVTQIDLI